MKRILPLTFALAFSVQAQYVLDWHTIDGGGGTSTGSVYSVSGVIGQPDAGRMSGGTYTIAGGFWSIVAAIQTEGAPTLRIALNGGQVMLAWPNPSTGFQLQETPALAAPAWTTVGQTPSVVGSEKQIALPSQPGNRFFRLYQP